MEIKYIWTTERKRNHNMKKIINTPDAPAPIGPYSQAVQIDNCLYVSGQVAFIPGTDILKTDNIIEETRQVMDNISAILKAAGMNCSNIVKTSIFLMNMSNFVKVNEVYASYFEKDFPARETIQVSGLPKNVNVEISVIAAI